MAKTRKKSKKKPCELGENKCLFQMGRSRCMAFAGKGSYYLDNSPTALFRPISDITYEECMEAEVAERGLSWDIIRYSKGWYVPNEDGMNRRSVMINKKVKDVKEQTSGSASTRTNEKVMEVTKRKGIEYVDDGHKRVMKSVGTGKVIGEEKSLFDL